jgi:purine nucleosidase
MRNVILDCDTGTDDALALLMLLSEPKKINLLGVTCVHGNVGVDKVVHNTLGVLEMAGRTDIPVFRGASKPWLTPGKLGDGAFGDDGLGGVTLPVTINPLERPAFFYLRDTLRAAKDKSITLVATGPMTNIAILFKEHPELTEKVEELVIMGGCNEVLDAQNQKRYGNITPHAEFNFFCDARAAAEIPPLGHVRKMPITLSTLDTAQNGSGLVATPERLDRLQREIGLRHGKTMRNFANAAAHLDMPKFGAQGAYVNDLNTALWLLKPELFDTKKCGLVVTLKGPKEGRSEFTANNYLKRLLPIKDPEAAFDYMIGQWSAVLNPHP